MKKFLSILRNLAHVGSGILLINPDPRYQAVGAILALLATTGSQLSAKPPKLHGVPLKVKVLTGEVIGGGVASTEERGRS